MNIGLTPALERRMFADALYHAACSLEFRRGADQFERSSRPWKALIRTAKHHEAHVRHIADRITVYLRLQG